MNQREPQFEEFKIPGHNITVPIMVLHGKRYLQVQQRVVWFNLEKQDWTIETKVEAEGKDTEGLILWVRFICEIRDPSGRLLRTARKTKSISGDKDFESCETGAIGRALSLMGYGTAYSEDMDEGDDIADSPQPPSKPKDKNKLDAKSKVKDQIESQKLYMQTATDGVFVNKTFEEIFNTDLSTGFSWTKKLNDQIKEGAKLQPWKIKYLTYAQEMGMNL